MNRRILCPIAFCLLTALGCTDARFTRPKEVVPRGSDIRTPESRSASLTRWEDVEPVVSWLQYAVIALILGAICWFVWRRFLSPGARRA